MSTETPLYGRFRVAQKDYYLGEATRVSPDKTILDWEKAPLAEVFFAHRAGEAFEVELAGRTVSGVLAEKELFGLEGPPPRLAPRPPEARSRPRFGLRVELDATQRAAIALPRERSLLVLGEAGFGKTTVALHRLAHLVGSRGPVRALVLVPTEGLRAMCTDLLDSLGCVGVEVSTVDAWLLREARRVFPKLPLRDSTGAGAAVIRAKRARSLREVLPVIAARRRGTARRSDLLHLFGDSAFVNAAAVEHTKVQFSRRSERVFAHVDADRLATLDGRELDAGTPLDDAETLDAEDAPVLFELHRLRVGAPAAIASYEHVVIDEAQELAPLELAAIGSAVAPGGTITIAGDERQQTDDTACFESWEQTLRDLSREDLTGAAMSRVTLAESYRCPPEVVRFARGLFESTGKVASFDPREVLFSSFPNACAQAAAIIDAVLELDDPRATIAVVCRTADSARLFAGRLRRGVPDLFVAPVDEVKGLEFDYVIVPERFGDDALSRRAMYVASTRAIHQLWISFSL